MTQAANAVSPEQIDTISGYLDDLAEDGKALFDAVSTTTCGSPETLEHWRETWAAMVNAKFEERDCYAISITAPMPVVDWIELSTVQEGVAVRQMETKGITTDKGNLNRSLARRAASSLMG